MMTKGKGYPEHVKDTGKSFGDAYADDVTGGRNVRSVLNEWDDFSWKASDGKKGSKKKQMNIWDEVVQGFNEEINKLRLTLSNGSAEDYSHYRQIVGSISSLEWARDNLTDIVKKRMYMEDDEQ